MTWARHHTLMRWDLVVAFDAGSVQTACNGRWPLTDEYAIHDSPPVSQCCPCCLSHFASAAARLTTPMPPGLGGGTFSSASQLSARLCGADNPGSGNGAADPDLSPASSNQDTGCDFGDAGIRLDPAAGTSSPARSATQEGGRVTDRGICRCDREQGDSDCDVHPSCEGCGASLNGLTQYMWPPWRRLCMTCYYGRAESRPTVAPPGQAMEFDLGDLEEK